MADTTKARSFFVGLITTVFAFIGADGAIHMSEEIKNASTVVPHALVASIALNGIMGFAMLIAILFCIGDIDNALSTATGFPSSKFSNRLFDKRRCHSHGCCRPVSDDLRHYCCTGRCLKNDVGLRP